MGPTSHVIHVGPTLLTHVVTVATLVQRYCNDDLKACGDLGIDQSRLEGGGPVSSSWK